MSTSITPGQDKQFRRFVEDAATKAVGLALGHGSFDKDSLQRLFANGDEFQAAVIATIIVKSRELSLPSQFTDEEASSSVGYFSGYTKPIGIAQQVNRLRKLFPGIGFANEKLVEQSLPIGAEGYFAIPRWEEFAPTYGEAVQKVMDTFKQIRGGMFYNYLEGKFGAEYLRQHTKTVAAFQKLGEEQKGYDILVVPAQFGLTHRGRSVRRARKVMNAFEFGLGLFAVGMMLLTHENRLQHMNDLRINLAGDERSRAADGSFGSTPCFINDGGGIKVYGGRDVNEAQVYYGSASGFLPQ